MRILEGSLNISLIIESELINSLVRAGHQFGNHDNWRDLCKCGIEPPGFISHDVSYAILWSLFYFILTEILSFVFFCY